MDFEKANLERKYENLLAEFNEMKTHSEQYNTLLETLNTDLREEKAKVVHLEEEKRALQEQNDEARREADLLVESNADLKEKVGSLLTQLSEAQSAESFLGNERINVVASLSKFDTPSSSSGMLPIAEKSGESVSDLKSKTSSPMKSRDQSPMKSESKTMREAVAAAEAKWEHAFMEKQVAHEKEKAELQGKIETMEKAHAKEIKQKESEIRTAQQVSQAAQSKMTEIQDQKQDHDKLQTELEVQQVLVVQLQAKLDKVKEEHEETIQQMKEERRELSDKSEQLLHQVRAEKSSIEKGHENAVIYHQQKIESIENDLNGKLQEKIRELETLQQALDFANDELTEARAELEEEKNNVKSIESSASAKHSAQEKLFGEQNLTITKMEREHSEQLRQMETKFWAENNSAQSENVQHKAEIKKLNEQLDWLRKNQEADHKAAIEEKVDKIDALTSDLIDKQQECEDLQNEIKKLTSDYDAKIKIFEEELNDAVSLSQESRDALDQLQSQHEKSLAELRREKLLLEAELECAKAANDGISDDHVPKAEHLEKLTKLKDTMTKDHEEQIKAVMDQTKEIQRNHGYAQNKALIEKEQQLRKFHDEQIATYTTHILAKQQRIADLEKQLEEVGVLRETAARQRVDHAKDLELQRQRLREEHKRAVDALKAQMSIVEEAGKQQYIFILKNILIHDINTQC